MKTTKTITIFCAVLMLGLFAFYDQAEAENTYDLKADSLIMNSAKCEINQPCSFTARVKNLGADFILNYHLKFTVSGDGYKNDSQNSVSPGLGTVIKTNDYLTFNVSGSFTKIGSIALKFTVNSTGYLVESDSNNNTISLTVTVSGYDLAVESLTVSPASPMINQDCYVQVKVKNNSSYRLHDGEGLDSIKVFPDFVVANASSTEPSQSQLINSGGYLYYGYEGKFTASGEKQLSFTVDQENVLKESDSVNNTKTAKITIYKPVDTDLIISSVSFSTDKIISGKPFDITIGIKNNGKTYLTDASGLSKDEFSHNLADYTYGLYDFIPDTFPTLSLPFKPADIFHYKFHGIFGRSGNFNLTFAINQSQRLIESNINNNSTSTAVKVYETQTDADSFSVLSKKVNFASSTTAIINWTTDNKTTGAINYIIVSHNISDDWVQDNNSTTTHATIINNLIPGENYNYILTAKNGIVEKTEMKDSFVMPGNNVLKITAGPAVAIGDKSAVFSWTTNLISSDQVYYKKPDAAGVNSAGAETLTAEHRVEIKDLALGVYNYFLSSTSTPGTNFKTGWASLEIKAAPAATTVETTNNNATSTAMASFVITNSSLYEKLKGKIILRVQSKGEAYYVSPKEKKMYYLGKPEDAFQIIRNQAAGMTNINLAKIPIGVSALSGADSDKDGLSDAFETAVGANLNQSDTDADGHGDREEVATGYSPIEKNKKLVIDKALTLKFKGRILLQVEGRGQAWYINPADQKRYFLASPADAFNIMRQLGVGVTNGDYASLGGK